MKYTVYYISWTVTGAYYSRCFNSQAERETFKRLHIDGTKTKNVSMWEKDCLCFT